ncbi:MAG: nucleotidyltransferase domain-containing protein [Candidatus Hodarchaeota archaeon]
MSREKILKNHYNSVTFTDSDWFLLKEKRRSALKLLNLFEKEGIKSFIYGSIARGDIHQDSDIDIIIPQSIPSYQIEFILHKNGYSNYFREIIMATPKDSIKLYIYLSELESITVPLSKLDKNTMDFYDFGGKLSFNELKSDIRTSGIDKRLVLIKPTPNGYKEYSVIGNEHLAAKEINVSINTINERKKVLLKRQKHGRTGVFLKRQLDINESTEEVLKKLSDKKSIIRKKLYQR